MFIRRVLQPILDESHDLLVAIFRERIESEVDDFLLEAFYNVCCASCCQQVPYSWTLFQSSELLYRLVHETKRLWVALI